MDIGRFKSMHNARTAPFTNALESAAIVGKE